MKKKSKVPKRKSVQPIPKGFHTVTPFLMVQKAGMLIEFVKKAFGAKVTFMMKGDNDSVLHSTLKIGDSMIMMADATQGYPAMPGMLHLYVKDVDSFYKKAIAVGGTSLREPTTEFYGDRSAGIKDEWGNQWWMATQVEIVSQKEMKKREDQFRKERK